MATMLQHPIVQAVLLLACYAVLPAHGTCPTQQRTYPQICSTSNWNFSAYNFTTLAPFSNYCEACQRTPVLEIDLSRNLLTTVQASSFAGFINATTLLLSHNSISSLPSDFIKELNSAMPQLKTLSLRGNQLTQVVGTMLRGSRTVESLDLSYNHIQTIERGAFSSKLKVISLSHNRLSTLPLYTFYSVVTLDLSNNNLTILKKGVLDEFYSAETVNLANNKIKTVTTDAFYRCIQVRYLNLSGNSIQSLNVGTFQNYHLRDIDLTNNPMSSFQEGLFDGPKVLSQIRVASPQVNQACGLVQPFLRGANVTAANDLPQQFAAHDATCRKQGHRLECSTPTGLSCTACTFSVKEMAYVNNTGGVVCEKSFVFDGPQPQLCAAGKDIVGKCVCPTELRNNSEHIMYGSATMDGNLTCTLGYALIGSSTGLRCGPDGTWLGGTCQKISAYCPGYKVPFGSVPAASLWGRATFACDYNYYSNGGVPPYCAPGNGATGKWQSYGLPNPGGCAACRSAERNGVVDGNGKLTCNRGYWLRNPTQTPVCNPYGYWIGTGFCGGCISTDPNGVADSNGILTCNTGYRKTSAGNVTKTPMCNDLGYWTGEGSCQAIPDFCPTTRMNGGFVLANKINAAVPLSCPVGYRATGGLYTCRVSDGNTSHWVGSGKCVAEICPTTRMNGGFLLANKTNATVPLSCSIGQSATGGLYTCRLSDGHTNHWVGSGKCVVKEAYCPLYADTRGELKPAALEAHQLPRCFAGNHLVERITSVCHAASLEGGIWIKRAWCTPVDNYCKAATRNGGQLPNSHVNDKKALMCGDSKYYLGQGYTCQEKDATSGVWTGSGQCIGNPAAIAQLSGDLSTTAYLIPVGEMLQFEAAKTACSSQIAKFEHLNEARTEIQRLVNTIGQGKTGIVQLWFQTSQGKAATVFGIVGTQANMLYGWQVADAELGSTIAYPVCSTYSSD